jgi:Kef-type K+ transport system membrane component KefB
VVKNDPEVWVKKPTIQATKALEVPDMMPDISLVGLVVVAAIAFLVPLALGLVSSVRIPSVILEIAAGIVIGPAVLGLVEVDLPLQVLAMLGLAFLLLLAGLEIDLDRLRGAAA